LNDELSNVPTETPNAISSDSDILGNLERVRARIADACRDAARDPDSVHLLAVSKTKPASMIQDAISRGQRHFGENYLQDALPKIEAIGGAATWHFIGTIQSNKTRPIAEHFDWVHTVSSLKVAKRLNEQRPEGKPPLKIFIQVNVDDDPAKSGFHPDHLAETIQAITPFTRLELQGLMTLPTERSSISTQRKPFQQLRHLQQSHCVDHPELSMGMSRDLEAAILEGATWVRIGTDIFGTRETL
jgi:pyridoxal phosphate enzyme (YggS family)